MFRSRTGWLRSRAAAAGTKLDCSGQAEIGSQPDGVPCSRDCLVPFVKGLMPGSYIVEVFRIAGPHRKRTAGQSK